MTNTLYKKFLLGKKGIFFTIISLILVIMILLIVSYKFSNKLRFKEVVISRRVDSVNNLIKSIDNDLERAIFISGFRTILGMQQYIEEHGVFFNNTEDSFREIFLFGKFGNETISIMNDSSFLNWTSRIIEKSRELNVRVNFTNINVSVWQQDPWNVKVRVVMLGSFSEMSGLGNWSYYFNRTSTISIIGFEDPLYIVNGYGKVTNTINKTPINNFVVGNDTTNLLFHLNHSLYKESTRAPSFLMRFSNNLTASNVGIESLVNLNDFIEAGIPTRTKSVVDYIYFSNRTTSDLCVDNDKAEPDLPSWFRLDLNDDHVGTYEIGGINKTCS